MLPRQHSRGEGSLVVVGQNCLLRLLDNLAAVDFRRNIMHGAAVRFDSGGERAPMRIEAGEIRQQRRMNVDEATAITADESGAQNPHKPGQRDDARRKAVDRRREIGFESGAVGIVRGRDDDGRNAALARDIEAGAAGLSLMAARTLPRVMALSSNACRLLPRPEIKTTAPSFIIYLF